METAQNDTESGMLDLLGVVQRRFGSILLVFLAVTILGTGAAFLIPAQYEAVTLVRVEDPETVGMFFKGIGLPIPHKQILTSIDLDIRRADFLEDLIERVDVDEGYRRGDQREYNRLMDRVIKNLKVKLVPQKLGPDHFEVSYTGRDGVKVATFVNGIRDKYQAEFERRYREDIRGAHDTVKAIYNGAVTNHRSAMRSFEEFQNREGAEYGTPDDAYARFRDRLGKLEQERDATDADFKTKKQALADVEAQLTAVPSVVEAGSTRSLSDAWKLQKAKVDQLEETLAGLSKRVTPAHRDYIRTKAALDSETARLARVPQWDETSRSTSQNQTWLDLDGRRRTLQVDVEGLKSRLGRLDETLKALNLELKAVPDKVRRAGELKATVDRAVAELASASAAYGAARTTKERFVDKTRSLFVPLSVPTPSEVADDDPVFPNTALFIGLAAVVGLLMGLGVAFLREFASPSFTTSAQVATALPVPMLGSVGDLSTHAEVTAAAGRRRVGLIIAGILVAILAYLHIAYFTRSMNGSMPRWAFDAMRRVYGKN